MTELTRAERRRSAREKEWVGHDAAQHQTLDPWRRLAIHTQDCRRCSSGDVETKGCEWLGRFYENNAQLVAESLGLDTHEEQSINPETGLPTELDDVGEEE